MNIGKIYTRNTRDDLGRYPNWPIQNSISLGSIGTYHGRTASFEWKTSLNELGINLINPPVTQSVISELYTTMNKVEFSFESKASHNSAKFEFKKNLSVATQGFELSYSKFLLDILVREIVNSIKNGLQWNHEWVIITEIWQASGFTTLISGTSKSNSEISTSGPISSPAFNVADFKLGLSLTKSSNMAYHGIAEKGKDGNLISPFFDIHKLIYDKKNGYYLKKYGRNESVIFPSLYE